MRWRIVGASAAERNQKRGISHTIAAAKLEV
jgi:hypothetical protein